MCTFSQHVETKVVFTICFRYLKFRRFLLELIANCILRFCTHVRADFAYFGMTLFSKTEKLCWNIFQDGRISIDREYCTTVAFCFESTFYVYRTLIYCDDFQTRSSMFSNGLVEGCWMVENGLSLRDSRSCFGQNYILNTDRNLN